MSGQGKRTEKRKKSSVLSGAAQASVRRQVLADFCRLVGQRISGKEPTRPVPPVKQLPPRQRQTLQLLLEGDSEKQIARKLEISRHTVHIYVKGLYKRFNVNSRGELLALWVRR